LDRDEVAMTKQRCMWRGSSFCVFKQKQHIYHKIVSTVVSWSLCCKGYLL